VNDARGRRPVGEVVLLILTVAICFCILTAIVATAIIAVLEPGSEVGVAASSLGTLVSALAGFVIGRALGGGH